MAAGHANQQAAAFESSAYSSSASSPDGWAPSTNPETRLQAQSSRDSKKPKGKGSRSTPQRCGVCGTVSLTPSDHNKHVKRFHEPRVLHLECPVPGCDKRSDHSGGIFRHVRKHHEEFAAVESNDIPAEGGECPYPGCGKWIKARNDNLRRHIDEQHKGEKRKRKTSRS